MSGICSCCLDAEGRDLDVAVDVEAVVLAGEHHAPVVHQRHVEALRVLYLALERADELTVLREDGQVEVVVIVRDGDLSRSVDPHSDRIVRDPFASDLAQEVALVIEDLDAVGPVVGDENLLPVVDDDTVGKLEMF